MSPESQQSTGRAQQEQRLPAEMRVEPTVEPTVEVDVGGHLPPEAAVVAVMHHETASEGTPAAPSNSRGDGAYEAVAAAEAAAEQAHLPPAELRVPPTVAPAVEVDDGTHLPPEAAVTPVTHQESRGTPL